MTWPTAILGASLVVAGLVCLAVVAWMTLSDPEKRIPGSGS